MDFAGRDLIRGIHYVLFNGAVIHMPLFKACVLPESISACFCRLVWCFDFCLKMEGRVMVIYDI